MAYVYMFFFQSLPSLFKLASSFKDEIKRHTATLALAQIDDLRRNKEKFFHASSEDAPSK